MLSSRTAVPLMRPSRAPPARPTATARTGFWVSRATKAHTTLSRLSWPPIERSTFPETTNRIAAVAAISRLETFRMMVWMFASVMKFEDWVCTYKLTRTMRIARPHLLDPPPGCAIACFGRRVRREVSAPAVVDISTDLSVEVGATGGVGGVAEQVEVDALCIGVGRPRVSDGVVVLLDRGWAVDGYGGDHGEQRGVFGL